MAHGYQLFPLVDCTNTNIVFVFHQNEGGIGKSRGSLVGGGSPEAKGSCEHQGEKTAAASKAFLGDTCARTVYTLTIEHRKNITWRCTIVSHQLEPAEVILNQIDSFQESAQLGPSSLLPTCTPIIPLPPLGLLTRLIHVTAQSPRSSTPS